MRTEAEALLLEANLIKRFRPRLQRAAAGRQVVPLHPDRRDHTAPQILKHRGARNRKGDYFGPFASAGAVNRTINIAGARVPAALLLRTPCSRAARGRACSTRSSAARRPAPARSALEDYADAGRGGDALPARREPERARRCIERLMQEAADEPRLRAGRQVPQPAVRRWPHVTADQSINPEGIEEADVFAAYQDGGQTCIQVFFFRSGPELGQPRLLPARRPVAGASSEVLESVHRPVLRRQAGAALHPAQPRACRAGAAGRGALAPRPSARSRSRVPQRGAKTGIVEHATQNAREALGRRLAETSSQRTLLDGLDGALRAARSAAPHRGVRQQPHPGHQRRRRHDRRRRRGLREEPVPQVQHQVGRPHARRRLRHDARGADAALQAAGAGRGRGARASDLRV